MDIEPFGKAKKRQNILQDVYEDNLRTVKGAAPSGEPRRRRTSGRVRMAVLLGCLLVGMTGFLYHRLQGGAPERPAPQLRAAGTDLAPPVPSPATPVQPSVIQDLSVDNLTVANLYGLQVRTIVIDPGHGGRDPGTIGQLGTMEKDIALDVARRLKLRLERQHGYRVLMTREGDVKRSLRERITFANEGNADLFISIHVNWLPVDTMQVIETYYFGARGDDQALRLARRENADSEYSVAEFQEMVQKLSDTVKHQESRGIAVSIQKSLYRNMRMLNEAVTDWGVKTAPFMVLLGVEAPSVLAEIACISNREEEAKLNSGDYREKLAMFLEKGIVDYLKQRPYTNAITEGTTAYGKEAD